MPYRAKVLAIVLAAVAASAIAPYDRRDWLLEHLATAAAACFFVWYERRAGGRPLPDRCYTYLGAFALLHVLGAHFLYSRVPYDDVAEALTGSRLGAHFGWTRNHYDRFVHFAFGLLGLPALAELVRRHVTPRHGFTLLVSVAFVGLFSKLYELAEWGIAVWLSPEAAEAYNGQQGDPFDAQKDMGLAFLGSLLAAAVLAVRHRPPRQSH